MNVRMICTLFLIALGSSISATEIIEINSDTPYSSGIIKFTDEDIHFSTGLTLTRKYYYNFYIFDDVYFCNADSNLYTSFATNSFSEDRNKEDEYKKISTWDSVKSVDTTVKVLDTVLLEKPLSNIYGHYAYRISSDISYYMVQAEPTFNNILISQDSSGNFIKWQIVDFQVNRDTTSDEQFDEIITDSIKGIYLKWEIDSLGNGKFPCSPLSNKKIISSNTSSNQIKHIQVNNRLTFPAFETLTIAIYKSNGQLLKVSEGMTNFIALSGISKGFYIAQIKSNGMKKSVGFRIE